MARLLAPRCKDLVLIARRRKNLEELANECGNARTHIIDHDLEQPGAAAKLWDRFASLNLVPDLWINNAGFGLTGSILTTAEEREEAMIRLNVESLMVLTKRAAQRMEKQRSGVILNIASVAAFQAGPGMAVYFASKAFVLSFSRAVDAEMSDHGVRCLTLCPGTTDSEFHQVAGSDRSKWMHHLGKKSSREIAEHAIWQIEKRKAVLIPGVINKAMILAVKFLPASLVSRVAAGILSIKDA
jgi:short-subunit dehydrogenase